MQVKRACPICKGFHPPPKYVPKFIVTRRPMELIMFDLTRLPCPDVSGDVQVLLVKDHFTRYVWGFTLPSKDPEGVHNKLVELFRKEGCPQRWHCDNGGEFCDAWVLKAIEAVNSNRFSFQLFAFHCMSSMFPFPYSL